MTKKQASAGRRGAASRVGRSGRPVRRHARRSPRSKRAPASGSRRHRSLAAARRAAARRGGAARSRSARAARLQPAAAGHGWSFPPEAAAVLCSARAESLEAAAAWMEKLGCRKLVLVRCGPGSAEPEAPAGAAELAAEASAADDAGLEAAQRIRLRHPHGGAAAWAAGAAAARQLQPRALLVADADEALQPASRMMLQAVLRAAPERPAAALAEDGGCRRPFSKWSPQTRLNAFLHWSLGGERRTAMSLERTPFALNGAALRRLEDGALLAQPPRALAALLAGGGSALPVRVRPSRVASEPIRPLAYADAIRLAGAPPRFRYPDHSRDRAAAAGHGEAGMNP
ncbi:hypothetical protein ACTHPH_21610 [Paenibacillus pasadenensis]|uniref:hypothetical protein n=1 Tax=Paenibacillus pasadenensis TaxID=217090 RepID=UPI000429A9A7|nr:hypothetical protein [Paenibacillus pasadenensis]